MLLCTVKGREGIVDDPHLLAQVPVWHAVDTRQGNVTAWGVLKGSPEDVTFEAGTEGWRGIFPTTLLPYARRVSGQRRRENREMCELRKLPLFLAL